MGRAGSGWLRPQKFNIAGNFSSVTSYKNKIITEIENREVEFFNINPTLSSYLKFLTNNANNNKSFNNFNKFYDFLESSKTLNEIQIYFAEVVGPIYLIENSNERFSRNSKIKIPSNSSTSGYDFEIDAASVSVKTPTGRGNTLKPNDIVSNIPFRTYIKTQGSLEEKKIYNLFELLDGNSALEGPVQALYSKKNSKAILSEVAESKWGKVLPMYEDLSDKIKRSIFRDHEDMISKWSDNLSINVNLKKFLEQYLKTSGLSLFSLKIDRTSGIATPKHKTTVKTASIKGKGKKQPGEKLGIAFTF
jgi:hypothetical protein